MGVVESNHRHMSFRILSIILLILYVYICVCVCACARVCVRERERDVGDQRVKSIYKFQWDTIT